MIRFAHDHGFQVGIHSIGDLAIQAAIDGFVKAETEDPRGLRHYVMHVDFITAEQARPCGRARPGGEHHPHPALDHLRHERRRGGPWSRCEKEWPYRLIADAGCHLSASSDAPCTYPSWLQGVQSAVLRESKATGTVYSPDQRLTVEEAIRMYTIGRGVAGLPGGHQGFHRTGQAGRSMRARSGHPRPWTRTISPPSTT